MAKAHRVLLDTNILLRLSQRKDPNHQIIRQAIKKLINNDGAELCYTLQNLTELWNVCTRPADRNGYGFSTEDADKRVKVVERLFTFLPDTHQVYEEWRDIVVTHRVLGVQVHDARLVATMKAHGIKEILTLNDADFRRYSGITSLTPAAALVT